MSVATDMARPFATELQTAKRVLIGTHLNPDGDALGSAVGLSQYLDQLGIVNSVVCHHEAPRNLRFLPGVDRVRQSVAPDQEYDLGIICDLDSLERLGSLQPAFEALPRTVVIDHHVPMEQPGDLRIIDTAASATAVILTEMLTFLDAAFTPEMATCLLTGIVTDTGSFRFRNTNPKALALAATLLDHGADIAKVSEEIFQRRPLSGARILGRMLDKFVLECDDQLCWSYLEFEDFESSGAKDEDTEGFVNELLSIDTVQIAFLARENKPGRARVSIRSRGGFDVAEIARQFGGGGHRNAAGLTFDSDIHGQVAELRSAIAACLASS